MRVGRYDDVDDRVRSFVPRVMVVGLFYEIGRGG